jgi:hypothetical protein
MSYYLFPKPTLSSNQIKIQIQTQNKNIYSISPSLQRYLCELIDQIHENAREYEYIQREMHPYYHGILENGPDDSYYEVVEIIHTMRINSYLDYYVAKNIQILNLGANSNAILHSRKNLGRNDIHNCDLSIMQFSNLFQKMHIIFADYMSDPRSMLIRLCTILVYQTKNGVLIWKIGDCFTPLMLDIIYFIQEIQHNYEGITISGGEPFDQYPQLMAFASMIKRVTKLNILCYSGYYLKELEEKFSDKAFYQCLDFL